MEILLEYPKEIVDRYLRSMGYDPKHVDRDKRMAFTKTYRFQAFAQRMSNLITNEQISMKTSKVIDSVKKTSVHDKAASLSSRVHRMKPQGTIKTEESSYLDESHMSELHADIGELMDQHIDNYKKKGGAEALMHKSSNAATKIQSMHGLERKHAEKFVNDYVESKMNESVKWEDLTQDERTEASKHMAHKINPANIWSKPKGKPEGRVKEYLDKKQNESTSDELKESKQIQLIKSIYREIREDLYDHEKDNKDGTTYGKQPKFKSSKEENTGDEKKEAAAILSGGTTLTGQKRDDVEIDPVLKKNKPGISNTDPSNYK